MDGRFDEFAACCVLMNGFVSLSGVFAIVLTVEVSRAQHHESFDSILQETPLQSGKQGGQPLVPIRACGRRASYVRPGVSDYEKINTSGA